MSNRDEFNKRTRTDAAKRAGYRCSHPACPRLLVGPAKSDSTKSADLGIAAHICAAAPGGPRHKEEQSSIERSSIKNCIFLCRDHAGLIDANNGIDYSEEELQRWKNDHERAISIQLERGDISATSFASASWEEATKLEAPQTRATRILEERSKYWKYQYLLAQLVAGMEQAQTSRITKLQSVALSSGRKIQIESIADFTSQIDYLVELLVDSVKVMGPLFDGLSSTEVKPFYIAMARRASAESSV